MTIYAKAADIIEQDGWTQGMYKNHDTGCWCAMGAVMQAANKLGILYNEDELKPLGQALKGIDKAFLQEYETEDAIVEWNDTAGRSKEEVVALLRRADEIAKETPPVVQPNPF